MASKNKSTEVISPEQAERFMTQYAKASTELKKIEAKIEKATQKVVEGYQESIDDLKSQQAEAFEKLEVFCEANPDLFADRKSFEMSTGRVGYQTGNPKLTTMKGFTWASVVPLVKSKLKDFLRTKVEIDKASLLSKRDDAAIVKKMNACGIEVVQDETFYVESFETELASS